MPIGLGHTVVINKDKSRAASFSGPEVSRSTRSGVGLSKDNQREALPELRHHVLDPATPVIDHDDFIGHITDLRRDGSQETPQALRTLESRDHNAQKKIFGIETG